MVVGVPGVLGEPNQLSLVFLGHDASFPGSGQTPFTERLAAALQIDRAEAERLVAEAPVVLNFAASLERARHLEALLKGIGAHVVVAVNRADETEDATSEAPTQEVPVVTPGDFMLTPDTERTAEHDAAMSGSTREELALALETDLAVSDEFEKASPLSALDMPALTDEHLKRVCTKELPVLSQRFLNAAETGGDLPEVRAGSADLELKLVWGEKVDVAPVRPLTLEFESEEDDDLDDDLDLDDDALNADSRPLPVPNLPPMQFEAPQWQPPAIEPDDDDDDDDDDEVVCPKCGFRQAPSDTCMLCGVVFGKFHAAVQRARKRGIIPGQATAAAALPRRPSIPPRAASLAPSGGAPPRSASLPPRGASFAPPRGASFTPADRTSVAPPPKKRSRHIELILIGVAIAGALASLYLIVR